MIKSRLEIDGINVGYINELPISTTYQIADIREPEKKSTESTKTILIPGSPEIKLIFENIFQVNSQLTNFNPNIKTPAKYYVNEVLVFDGSLQLLRINNKYINDYNSSTFECSMIGNSGNLFLSLSGLYMTDLDISDLDHVYSFVSSMFTPTLGEGYGYGYQDYGLNTAGTPLSTVWNFNWLKPLIFEKELVMRIVQEQGFSIKAGGYFDSDYAKNIVIPDTYQGGLKMTTAQALDNECYIGMTAQQSSTPVAGSYVNTIVDFGWSYINTGVLITNIEFDDETTPYYDANNRWDTGTFRFTCNDYGYYNLSVSLDFDLEIDTFPATATSFTSSLGNFNVSVMFEKSIDGGTTWINIGNFDHAFSFNQLVSNPVVNTKFTTQLNSVLLNNTNKIRVSLFQSGTSVAARFVRFYNGITALTSGSSTSHFNINIGSVFLVKMTSLDLIDGQTVRMNNTLPDNVTQIDFLTSIFKAENLYIEQTKEVDNEYVIETREDFYETLIANAKDWTQKWAISEEEQIIPMGEVNWKRLIFTYKQDQDYYNKYYQDKYKEVFGTELIDTENEFNQSDKKIELVFSATPVAGTNLNNIVAPRYYSYDLATNQCKPLKCNIRRLYWAGLIACDNHQFNFGVNTSFRTTYPFVGHVDDPINPTIDLSFGIPREVFWKYPGSTYTDNNRYNERYSKYIEEITDANSKIVIKKIHLKEDDINQFHFSDLIFIKDAYYYVNIIKDYNPQINSLSETELLKLKAGTVFIPNNNIDANPPDDDGSQSERTSNQNNGTGMIYGTGNVNNGNSLIIGDNNVVG